MKAKRRLKKEAKIVIFGAIIIVLAACGILIYSHMNRFDYISNLSENAVTINDTNICLRELSYYIIKVEKTGQERAVAYNKNNPGSYWNLYMNEANDSGYVSDIAKRAAVNYCIRDNIYYMEALKKEYSLTEEEQSDLKYDAQNMYETMTLLERTMTEISQADYEIILLKERLAYKYMTDLVTSDDSGQLESYVLKYDIGGDYYEAIKSTYSIIFNEDLLENVRVGFITVNNDLKRGKK